MTVIKSSIAKSKKVHFAKKVVNYGNDTYDYVDTRISRDFEKYKDQQLIKNFAKHNVISDQAAGLAIKLKNSVDMSLVINVYKVLDNNYLNPQANKTKHQLLQRFPDLAYT